MFSSGCRSDDYDGDDDEDKDGDDDNDGNQRCDLTWTTLARLLFKFPFNLKLKVVLWFLTLGQLHSRFF